MATVTATEARASLPELLDRVASGEEVTITRHGRPAAVLVRPTALRTRRADRAFESAGAIRRALADGRDAPLPTKRGLSTARAEELVAEIRAARDPH
ncbi:MAG: type II toxin-antitoxin system Phd/YefM family antitoxin [Acidimicrobiales bacterium]